MLLGFGEQLARLGVSLAVRKAEGGVLSSLLVLSKLVLRILQQLRVPLMIKPIVGLDLAVSDVVEGASRCFTPSLIVLLRRLYGPSAELPPEVIKS